MSWGGQKDTGKSEKGPPPLPCPCLRGPPRCAIYLGLLLLAGCTHSRQAVSQQLLADKDKTGRRAGVAESYVVACPDVLEVTVTGRPDLTRRAAIRADGRVDLGPLGQPRVEGRPPPRVAQVIEEQAGLPTGQVRVAVAAYNSQQIYLFGQVVGQERSVPYQGQETVLDLLQRVGGIKPGAAPDSVFVVRPHIAEGTRPEVFHVDLRAIVLKGDQSTNLRLQPFDQVQIGETPEAQWERCIPPFLRSLYDMLTRTRHPAPPPAPAPASWEGPADRQAQAP
jgi:protein involved in polysaccharide export with SLBB domain